MPKTEVKPKPKAAKKPAVKKPRGGARPGAGRKRKADKYAPQITRAEDKIADRLPDFVDNVIALADGGFEQITEVLEPAGMVMVDDTKIEYDAKENPRSVKIKRLAFPDKKPDEMVVTKVTRTTTAPDLAANQYLINRIMGAPTQRHEYADLNNEELLEEAARLFGRADEAGTSTPEI